MVAFGEPLGHVITLRGPFMVSRDFAIRDEPNIRLPMKNTRLTTTHSSSLRVSTQSASRVYSHHAHMLKHVCAWRWYTRGRFERTHEDVSDGHTGFFSVSHTIHHTAHTPHHKTQDTPQERNNNTTKQPTTTTIIQSGEAPFFNRRGASAPRWGVEACSPPSRRPNPIPAIPPYVVKTPHLHGAPTTEETSFVKP